jgi:hypothetical protein
MDPEVLRYYLLERLQLHEATGTAKLLADQAMADDLHVGLLDVQQQLETLASHGLVRLASSFNRHEAWLTPQGRQSLEEAMRQEPAARHIGF